MMRARNRVVLSRSAIVMSVALALFGTPGSAMASPETERSRARAEQHLGVLELDEAAAELELFAMDVPRDLRAIGSWARAASLRSLLGQNERALRDEAMVWRSSLTLSEGDASVFTKLALTATAARTTLKLARAACEEEDFARAGHLLDRRMAEIDRLGAPEERAEAHGMRARAAEGLGDERAATVEHSKVLSIAKTNEGKPGVDWHTGAREAVADARLAFADKKRVLVESLALEPYAGPNESNAIRAYLTTRVVPWLERKTRAIEDAERAYARVLGIDMPPPAPPSREGGDPNAPIAPWELDPVAADGARLSARGIVTAAERVGTMWASLRLELAKVPLAKGEWVGESYDVAYVRAKRWYASCAVVWQAHREGDASVCRAWLERNVRSEYRAMDELAPRLGHSGAVRMLPPVRIGGAN